MSDVDGETMIQALLLIREQCTGEDGQVDQERYEAAVAELAEGAGEAR